MAKRGKPRDKKYNAWPVKKEGLRKIGWIRAPKSSYTVDESGYIVPTKRDSEKKDRVSFGIRGKGAIQPGDTFSKIKSKFSSQQGYWPKSDYSQCPECGCDVKEKNLKRHLRRIHEIQVNDEELGELIKGTTSRDKS